MGFEPNMSETSRIVRGVTGIWLFAAAFSAYRAGRRTVALTAAIAGSGLLFNAWTKFCGCNAALGIDNSET